ncbi:MAG: Co2+/Mg2+ efflux protein ApaG [Saprospiraceae bacterium]|jgi:ApaG protein|nr:Co2+/Mg2+ efflux protein ApaG [Saprospiraceae bacterium]
METLTTHGIQISAEPFYLPHESIPIQHKYVFAYRITIVNQSADTVQLLRRHWYIVESNGVVREVEGEGVVGLQPVLAPGESHQYISWCPLMTDIGKMHGEFQMERQPLGIKFNVKIPAFKLLPPFKLN